MSFAHYESCRETGVQWLGQVPSHWTVKRLAHYFEERREKVSDRDYPPLSVTKDGVVPQLETAAKTDDGDNRKLVRAGDFVINSRSDRKGSAGLSELDGSVSLINTVLVPDREMNGRFASYLLRSPPFQEEFYRYGRGIVADLWTTRYSEMRNILLAIPPPEEQQAIVNLLDHEAAKIDAMIEEQRKLINLLKEKRQAVIIHAITKGLNPQAPMKDSGVTWLDAVPAHWNVRPLKHLVSLRSGGTPSKDRLELWGGDVPWASAKDLKSELLVDTVDHLADKALAEGIAEVFPAGSVVVLVRGMMLARTFPVCELTVPMAINQDLKALIPHSCVKSSFLAWALRASRQETLSRVDEAGHGTKALRMEAWASMRLPAPPLEEQARISEHVVRATAALDRLSEQAEVAMTLLAERKAALIASAVTGKIDVRSHAAVPSAGKLDLRLIVGSAIVRSLARKPTFGRVKFQKLLFLAEVHAGFDLGGKYTREAAGPLDRNLVADVERRLFQAGKVEILQPDGKGGQVEYRPANSGTKLETELAQLPEPAGDRLTCLIGLFADLDTRCTEAVTTLYAVWNDALIDGRQPTVKEIIDEVLNNWHPEKKEKFRADELETWLGWIDRQGLVPTGTGPKTQLGRLFA